MSEFIVKDLPNVDKEPLQKGNCPWCLEKLIDSSLYYKPGSDYCQECDDYFLSEVSNA